MRSNWHHLIFGLLLLENLAPLVEPGGHALVIAPVKLSIPFNGLVGLAALKVAQLSLATAVLAKGKLKILRSARRKISSRTVYPHPPRIKVLPPSFAPLHPVPGFNPWAPSFPPAFGHLGSASFIRPSFAKPPPFGPFGPFGYRPKPPFLNPPYFGPKPPHFGPVKPFGHAPSAFGPGPIALPPYLPPRLPPIPDYLKSKLVQPKDACILKMVCQFEFHPNKLGGGQLEDLLLGFSSPIGKKSASYFGRRRGRREASFWINIKQVDRDEKVGSEICENRYPSCHFSPVFKFDKRSGQIEPEMNVDDTRIQNSRLDKFVNEVGNRIAEWTAKLKVVRA